MTTIFKFSSFANRGNNSCCCFRANAFNFDNALAGFWLPEHSINFFIKKAYSTTKIIKEIIKFCNRPAHSNAKTIFRIFKDKRNSTTNSWDCSADCYSPIKQQSPDLTDCRSAVINNTLSCTVQSLNILLFRAFLGEKCIVGCIRAIAIACASLLSFFCPRTKGFTYWGLITFTLCPSFSNSRYQ